MTRWVWAGAVVAPAALLLGGCASTDTGSGDCSSHYEPIASAPTWGALKQAMLDAEDWGRVASLRSQSRGDDIDGRGVRVMRVVDLLDRDGRRLVQAEAWRTDDDEWAAGAWSQCLD